MTGIVNSVMFGVQGIAVRELLAAQGRAGEKPTPKDSAQAALVTGFVISSLVTPMEGIKSRLQVQYASSKGAQLYTGPIDCVRKVYRQLGLFRGIYRGWVPVVFCRMSNWSYFGAYEFWKRFFSGGEPNKKLPLAKAVLAGGLTGFCYWLSCYPMDVIKARIQAQPDTIPPKYAGIRDAARDIYRTEGMKGFFRGFTPCLIRAFPANACCFVAYEVVMRILPQ